MLDTASVIVTAVTADHPGIRVMGGRVRARSARQVLSGDDAAAVAQGAKGAISHTLET